MDYWIQSADLGSTEGAADTAEGLHAVFEGHDWSREEAWRTEREARGEESCPAGMGLVAEDGRILHLCPDGTEDPSMLVHYSWKEERRRFGLFSTRENHRVSWYDESRAALELIAWFVGGRNQSLLDRADERGRV